MALLPSALHGVLLLFAIVVLAISVDLARQETIGRVPFPIWFSAASGAFGMLTSALGTAALFLDFIPQKIVLTLDMLAGLLYAIAGIIIAARVSGTSCSDCKAMANNGVIFPGTDGKNGACSGEAQSWLGKRCVSLKADTAFLFLSVFVCAAIVAFTILSSSNMKFRRSGRVMA